MKKSLSNQKLWLRTLFVRGFLSVFFFSSAVHANQSSPRLLSETPTPQSEPCPSEDAIYLQEAKEAYEKAYSTSLKGLQQHTLVKNKVILRDSSDKISNLKKILGSPQPHDWSTKAAGCKDAFCVIRSLVDSDEAAYRLLTIPKVTNVIFTLSPRETKYDPAQHKRSSSIWKKSELRHFQQALQIVPPSFRNFQKDVRIYRTGVRDVVNDVVYSARSFPNMDIHVYNDAFRHGDLTFDGSDRTSFTQKVLIHELCHLYDISTEQSLLRLAAFNPDLAPKVSPSFYFNMLTKGFSDQAVSDIARQNSYEDFAETCAYYITNPRALNAHAPDKYKIIRNIVFQGQEFLNSPWNQPLFQDLEQFLTSDSAEAACEKDFTDFVTQSIEIDSAGRISEIIPAGMIAGSRPASAVTEKYSYKNWPAGSPGMNSVLQRRLIEFLPIAKKDPDFCKKGGEESIRKRSQNACPRTSSRLNTLTHYKNSMNFTHSALRCVSKKDYSRECLIEEQTREFLNAVGDSPLSRAVAQKTEHAAFPTHFRATLLNRLKIEEWFPTCLSQIHSVETEGRALRYTLKENIDSALNERAEPTKILTYPFLPALMSQNASQLGVRCFDAMRELFSARGIHFGANVTDSEIIALLNESEAYRSTVQSFENAIILPLISQARQNPDQKSTRPLSRVRGAKRFVRMWIRSNPQFAKVPQNVILDHLPLLK